MKNNYNTEIKGINQDQNAFSDKLTIMPERFASTSEPIKGSIVNQELNSTSGVRKVKQKS